MTDSKYTNFLQERKGNALSWIRAKFNIIKQTAAEFYTDLELRRQLAMPTTVQGEPQITQIKKIEC